MTLIPDAAADAFERRVICIGAGPAGLTAAYRLAQAGVPVTVLEANPTHVGGISRTVEHNGFLFDIGGHRFYSKSSEVEALWTEWLGDDFLVRPRRSRILYRGKFFDYPLKPVQALARLGLRESFRCIGSYVQRRLTSRAEPATFEDWVSDRFGARLFRIFFKTYTEKLWGMSCREISADWAAQRIQSLSLGRLAREALWPSRKNGPKTLITSFRYPRHGPGMMWEAAAKKAKALGAEIRLGCRVTELRNLDGDTWEVEFVDERNEKHVLRAGHVLSSAPLRDLARALHPAPHSLGAADRLRYRDFLTVAVMLRDRNRIPDNWIYVHDPDVRVGRIQNFKAWSPEMVPDPTLACYGMEYFCFQGDELWSASDDALIERAKAELLRLGLAEADDFVDATVVRQAKAYPIYDEGYAERLVEIRAELSTRYPTLHLVGRNGLHKYNNQDHAMLTALLAVKNILRGERTYDVWRVNENAEYLEEPLPAVTPDPRGPDLSH